MAHLSPGPADGTGSLTRWSTTASYRANPVGPRTECPVGARAATVNGAQIRDTRHLELRLRPLSGSSARCSQLGRICSMTAWISVGWVVSTVI